MKRDNKILCNQCGKELQQQEDMIREGYFPADIVFGYFSNKDGMKYFFDLCEECYDKMVSEFAVPVETQEVKEFL